MVKRKTKQNKKITVNTDEWFRLDNAATLYSLISSPKNTCMFRLEAGLTTIINVTVLQKSLETIISRFPYYRVNLQPGFFWHFWNSNPEVPHVEADTPAPCEEMAITKNNTFPFRVRAHGNRIAVEFHHSISDGYGALVFLKTLLSQYFQLKGIKGPLWQNVLKPGELPDPAEYEDAYKKHCRHFVPSPPKDPQVFSLPFKTDFSIPDIRTTGTISLKQLLPKVKKLNISLTDFLAALLLETFQDIVYTIPFAKRKNKMKPLRILVPVNLRNIYSSKTMRNFTLYVNPQIDPRLGKYSFNDILKNVFHYMKSSVNPKNISMQIKRNVRAELHPLLRATPLLLKKILLRVVSLFMYAQTNNAVLSNLGRVEFPAAVSEHVTDVQFILPPGRGVKICLTLTSFQDTLYLNFLRGHREPEIEKRFFRKLASLGIRVTILDSQKGYTHGHL
ncbi:MAG: hypothetical protein JW904_11355 [Spirochaetales bacterium]|nr:hypothetical protein [Spirochaetales bacterium]